jgi:transcriptional regulator with XRE-family HTH domain
MTVLRKTGAPATTGQRDAPDAPTTWAPSIADTWLRRGAGWLHQETAPLVDRAANLQDAVADLHADAKAKDLAARTSVKARKSVSGLLAELGQERGMSWSDIAAWAGVSVSAVRKWRKGEAATPENRNRLAKIAALLDWLAEYMIEDPAQWLEIEFALPAGYNIRPLDLLLEGQVDKLLDIAAERKTPEQVLDELEPEWRDSRRSDFEVILAADGDRAIRARKS